jgi:hypothetical protein
MSPVEFIVVIAGLKMMLSVAIVNNVENLSIQTKRTSNQFSLFL